VKPATSLWSIVFEQFKDFIIQLLLAACFVSLVVGLIDDPQEGWIESVAIIIAVVIVVSVSSVQDYLKELQFRKLNAETQRYQVTVLRSGILHSLWIDEIVVGDLLHLNPGDIAPADGVLVKSYGIFADESMLTGESVNVEKSQNNPFVIAGSIIAEGTGEMIICAVGSNSTSGKSRKLVLDEGVEEKTPLQEKLEVVAKQIGYLGAVAAVCIFLALMIIEVINAGKEGEWTSENTELVLTAFIIAITILVVAIPEGLPLAVTLSLAFSMRKMKNQNIFVKQLRACETMGGCDQLLIDKTGTLTINEMTVVKGHLCGKEVEVLDPELTQAAKEEIARCISRNSTAEIKDEQGKTQRVGNRTECAMLQMLSDWGLDYLKFRDFHTQTMQIPFSSLSKKMTSLHTYSSEEAYLYSKGAPEKLISKCSFVLVEGEIQELTLTKKEEYNSLIKEWNEQMLRTISLAFKKASLEELGLPQEPNKSQVEAAEKDLVLIGFLGIKDPVRPEANQAIRSLKYTGVSTRIITGDNPEIAVSIAKECNILGEDYKSGRVILGQDFDEKIGGLNTEDKDKWTVNNQTEFEKLTKPLRILARCSPQDKLLLTVGLRNMDHTVAVTGDGTNDAAALQKADIGIAMMSATPMAKDAADIILLDDNIESIVTAIKWGRNIYNNIRRFLQFQVTVNIVALLVCLVGAVAFGDSPLTATQMLWVNLLMDSLAALALATQDPDERILESSPYRKNEYILSKVMIANIAFQSVYQISILLGVLFASPYVLEIDKGWDSDWPEEETEHYTLFFNVFVMLQLFNQFNCRKIELNELNVFKGLLYNWVFTVIVSFEFVLQVLFVQYGGSVMNTERLELVEHLVCVLIGVSTVLATFMFKLVAKNIIK